MTDDAHLVEQKISGEEILKGHFLHALRDQVLLPNGRQAVREYVVHPGAVMVIPLLDDGSGQLKLVLERQYRYPLARVMIEFPAGKLDPGESVQRCAERELLEETGYTARAWARAGVMHPVISYSTEFIDIWFARDLLPGARKLDDGEFLDVITATPAEFLQWCQQGLVTDAKTLAGALWVQNALMGTWPLAWATSVSA